MSANLLTRYPAPPRPGRPARLDPLEARALFALGQKRIIQPNDPDYPTTEAARRRLIASGALLEPEKPGSAAAAQASALTRLCNLCRFRISEANSDDLSQGLCTSCISRPEAKRLQSGGSIVTNQQGIRSFTEAEKVMIRRMHGMLSAKELLALLNERLVSDLGPNAARHTVQQLEAEIGDVPKDAPAGGYDRVGLRKLIAHARRNGVLQMISGRVIDDFAIVFSLNTRQVLVLKDILQQDQEDA